MFKKSNWSWWLALAGIVSLGGIFRFVAISRADLYVDDAIDSFRSLGWFDSFISSTQLTPFDWLGQHFAWWTGLSFHDAPPLGFLIQHFFFLFGDNGFIAKLPFAIFGLLTVFLFYFYGRTIFGHSSALVGAAILSLSSYAIFAASAGYLEGIEIFFITGALLLALKWFTEPVTKKYFYLLVIFLAGAFLTKYTAIFLIPSLFILAWFKRHTLKSVVTGKQWLMAGLLFLILLAPVFIYNIEMLAQRGHLDMALSSMVGIHSSDFGGLSQRSASLNIFGNLQAVALTISRNYSPGLLIVFLVAILINGFFLIKKTKQQTTTLFVLSNIVFCLVMLLFLGGATRFLIISLPLVALVVSNALFLIEDYSFESKILFRNIALIIVLLALAWETLYAFNTHVLIKPVSRSPLIFSASRVENYGWEQLDRFFQKELFQGELQRRTIKSGADLNYNPTDKTVIVYDDRLNWFAQYWYFIRYQVYYNQLVISDTLLLDSTKAKNMTEALTIARQASGRRFYIVLPARSEVIDPDRQKDPKMTNLAQDLGFLLLLRGAVPKVITNSAGQPAFNIYRSN